MGSLQTGLNKLNSIFHSALDCIKECYNFPSDTYRANEVKAGLFLHARGNSMLLEGSDPAKDEARNAFLRDAKIRDGMGHDELFDIIEKLDLYMHKKFPEKDQKSWEISERAFVKADHIADDIRTLSPEKIEHYAREFDQMKGSYSEPASVVDRTHG